MSVLFSEWPQQGQGDPAEAERCHHSAGETDAGEQEAGGQDTLCWNQVKACSFTILSCGQEKSQ